MLPRTIPAAGVADVESTQILAPAGGRSIVVIQNVSAIATIAARPGAAAELYAGANVMAAPMGYIVFHGEAAAAAIHIISDQAETPVTIAVG